MKLARIAYNSLDGPIPGLVVVQPEQHRVIDLAISERLRLQRQGATHEAALRLAKAMFPSSLTAALSVGNAFLVAAQGAIENADEEAVMPLSSIHLLPPLDPPLIRDFTTFQQHMENISARFGWLVNQQVFTIPLYYKGNSSTLIGLEQEVLWPNYTQVMDYELELGFVIGKSGRNLAPQETLSHLFGGTIFNDFSARDIQSEEMRSGFGPAKGKDLSVRLAPGSHRS